MFIEDDDKDGNENDGEDGREDGGRMWVRIVPRIVMRMGVWWLDIRHGSCTI